MRSVSGKIRITSFITGLLKRSASGLACVGARARVGGRGWRQELEEEGRGKRIGLGWVGLVGS